MRRLTFLLSALTLALLLQTASHGEELSDAVRAAVTRVEDHIVRIRPVGSLVSVEQEDVASVPSTGIVVSERGEILTSAFSLQGDPQAILVETRDGQRYPARVVAADLIRKLVLLQCEGGNWKPVDLSFTEIPAPGEWSIGLGRFYRTDQSAISVGVISAVNRIHGMAIQTDAKVSPVNYGGPLIDLSGQFRGILVPLSPRDEGGASAGVEWYDSGIGFAIPTRDVAMVLERLRKGADLKPGKFGIALKQVSLFSSDIVVERVVAGSPAAVAGLQSGDRLLSANNITINRPPILESLIAASYAGDTLNFEIERSGTKQMISVQLSDQLPEPEAGYLGLLPVGEKTKTEEPTELESDRKNGILCAVLEGGPAFEAGLRGRVRITAIQGKATETLPEFLTQLFSISPKQSVRVSVAAAGAETSKTGDVEFVAAAEPSGMRRLTESELIAACGAAGGNQVPTREEHQIEDIGGCVVFRPAASDRESQPGMLVLVSSSTETEERLLARWQSVMSSHNLVLVVPQNPERTGLTAEDVPLIAAAIQKVSSESEIDKTRTLLIAAHGQAEIAKRLIFALRSPVRGIVMLNGWFSGSEADDMGRSRRSVLLMDSSADPQSRALLDAARKRLTDCGLRVKTATSTTGLATDESIERVVADWSLLIKSL
ncbi:MAG: PDZ domain-containing protein [Planctomyces sp.]|nr:PDZ domain-containing protein [Planctomyces sp.]